MGIAHLLSLSLIIGLLAPAGAVSAGPNKKVDQMSSNELTTVKKKKKDFPKRPKKGEKSEIVDWRTANSKHYVKDDGEFVAELYDKEIFYQDNESEEWKTIDNNLVPSEKGNKGKGHKTKANKFEAFFPIDFKEKGLLFNYEYDGTAIDFYAVNGKNSKPKVNGNEVVFKNIFKDTDIKYTGDSDQIREDIILYSPKAPSSYTFEVRLENLNYEQTEKGDIVFTRKDSNRFAFLIPRPFMYEAGLIPNISSAVTQTIREEGGRIYIDIKADEKWLNDPSRQYPVTIDPPITTNPNYYEDTFVSSAQPAATGLDQYHHVYAGNNATYGKTESYIRFPLPQLPTGALVTKATVSLYNYLSVASPTKVDLYEVNEPWKEDSINWNSKPNKTQMAGKTFTVTGAGTYSFDLTTAVDAWYRGSKPNNGVALVANPDTSAIVGFTSSNYSSYQPSMTVEYSMDPNGSTSFWTYTDEDVMPFKGNLFIDDTDLSVDGRGLGMDLTRYYNSRQTTPDGFFGPNWISNLDMKVWDLHGSYAFLDENGTTYLFEKTSGSDGSSNGYAPPPGVGLGLKLEGTGTDEKVVITTNEHIEYVFNRATGRIEKVMDNNKQATSYVFQKDSIVITDPSGRQLTMMLDAKGKVASAAAPSGMTAAYTYDAATGALKSVQTTKGSESNSTAYTYVASSATPGRMLLTKETDGDNNSTDYEHDQYDRVRKVSDTVDGKISASTYTYVQSPRTVTVTGPGVTGQVGDTEQQSVVYSTNDNANVTKIDEKLNANQKAQTIYTWSELNQLTEVKDPNSQSTAISYTDDGKPLEVDFPDGNDIRMNYDPNENLISVKDRTDDVQGTLYDSKHNPTDVSDGIGNTTMLDYDANGNLTSQTDDLSLAHNLLANSGFENGTTHWKAVGSLGASEKFETVAADIVSHGFKTLHLLSQDGVDAESAFTFPVNEYQKYTFSMSLKTAVQTRTMLKVIWTKKDNTKVEQSFTMSGADTVARGWTRKSTGIEAPADAVKATVQLGVAGAGEAWFDNIAVEGGASRSDDNLVTNAGMEFDADKSTKADEWYPPSDAVTGISINYNKFKFGKSSERITGTPGVLKYVKQNLSVGGRAGSKFSISGWSLGEGIPADTGIKWRVQLNMNYTDGTIGNYGIAFDAANNEWQDVSRIVTAEKDFNDLSVVLMFDNMAATANAYFDDVKVTRVDAPSTSSVAGYNLIDNSSFEQDYDATNRPDGWNSLSATNYSEWINLERKDTDPQGSPIDYKKSNTFTGTRSILLTGNSSEEAALVRAESIAVQAGMTYTLIGYGKTVNAPASGLLLIARDASDKELTRIKTPVSDKDTDWKRVRYVFDTSMLPKGTAKVQAGVYKEAGGAGKAFFDNIRLQEGEFRSSFTYDNQGNYLNSVTTPNGNTTKLVSDANTGDTKEFTDALGNTFLYDYFMDGNAKSFTFPYQSQLGGAISNKTFTYEYDKSGNLTKIKDPNQNAVSVQYNEQNQVDKLTESASNIAGTAKSLVWDYNYDASGRLINVKSANGKTTTLTYDQGNRINSVKLGAKTFNYGFDLNNNLISYGNGTSLFKAEFDEMNNVTKVLEPTATRYLEAEYDAEGDRTLLNVVPNTATTFSYEYEYDSAGNPLRYTDVHAQKSIYYLHDESGRLVKSVFSGNVSNFYTYDKDGRMETSRSELLGKETGKWKYEYNAAGHLTKIVDELDSSKGISYHYDSLGQLVEEETAQGKKTFAYDEVGNRTSVVDGGQTTAYTYNKEKNRLLSVGGKAYTYDDSGNVLSDGTNQYVWGDDNKLSTVKNAAGTTTLASFSYDALGRRETITAGGVVKTLHYDGNLVTYVTNASNSILYRIGYDHNGRPVVFRSNGVNYWYQYNAHGDVVALLDDNGAVKVSYSYDAWGNHTSKAPTDATLKSVYENNPYRYAGSWYDQETGKYYLGARFYDPAIGRFLSKDPVGVRVGSHLGTNAYAYADNNPIMYADPHGEWVWIVVDIATGVALDYAMYRYGGGKGKFKWGASLRSNAAWSLIPGGGYAKKYKKAKKFLKMKRKSKARGCNCFTAGTKVLTDEGEKPIEEIEVGDKVLSKDENHVDGVVGYKEVTALYQNQRDDIIKLHIGKQMIETTDNHPFWVEGKGWVFADELEAGDRLQKDDGSDLTIDRIEFVKLNEPVTVYNFTVEDYHTYYVTDLGIWVHNTEGPCNLDKIEDKYLKKRGIDAHELKKDHLGRKAKISEYDLYVDKKTGEIFIVRKPKYNKNGQKPISTGEKIK